MKNLMTHQTSEIKWTGVLVGWKRVWDRLRLLVCIFLIWIITSIVPGETDEGERIIQGIIIMLSSLKEVKNADKNM